MSGRSSLIAAALLALVACASPYQPVPWPQPPPIPAPPPPPDLPPPPPPVPVPPPVSETASALLSRIPLGTSAAEVSSIVGRPPLAISSGDGPPVSRWYVKDPDGSEWLVFVVFDGGKASRKGAAKVGVVR